MSLLMACNSPWLDLSAAGLLAGLVCPIPEM
jgi:hypothetical protein